MDLYLVRHAKAYKRDFERWPDDADRPLTPEGEEEFRSVALRLGEVARVEEVFSSHFARAWRTAELLSEEAGWPRPRALAQLEPDASPHKVLRALDNNGQPQSVALVGHRPHLHLLASFLLTGQLGGIDIRIKKGGVVALRFEDEAIPGEAALLWAAPPLLLL